MQLPQVKTAMCLCDLLVLQISCRPVMTGFLSSASDIKQRHHRPAVLLGRGFRQKLQLTV